MQLCIGASIPHFKINAPFFYRPLFLEYANLWARINKVVNEHIVDYHPSPSVLTSRIYCLICLLLRALSFSRTFVVFSNKPEYSTTVSGNFQIYGVQVTGKCESENQIIFTRGFQAKNSSPGSYHHHPHKGKLF